MVALLVVKRSADDRRCSSMHIYTVSEYCTLSVDINKIPHIYGDKPNIYAHNFNT